ncbi:MAG TPA: Ig-like domain-containing protein [Armatimonadota bacterium]|nr:Ig-like domain-containing protein [Armatimonadota bacterium]
MQVPVSLRVFLPLIFALGLLLAVSQPVFAQSTIVITLTSDTDSIVADGHSQANISVQAFVDQNHYTGPLQVQLTSSLGDLQPNNLSLQDGIAWTHLRAGAATGIATITVQILSGARQVIQPAPLAIAFLPPGTRPSAASSQRFLMARADSLAYSVDLQRIVALQHAKMSFQRVQVTADSITFDATKMVMRAESLTTTPVIARSLGQKIEARKLEIDFQAAEGAALVTTADGTIALRQFRLSQFQLQPYVGVAPETLFEPIDIDGSAVYIRGRWLRLYPGNELHVGSASLYVSGKHVLSLPLYRLSLNPYSPNADQYVSYDSYSGLGINIPFYYMLSDHGMGSLRITHSQPTGYFGTDAQGGWALGLRQDYGQSVAGLGPSLASGGTVTLDRITSHDWGFSWRHNQRILSSGIATGYVYSPDHRTLNANLTMSMPVHGLDLSLTSFGTHQLGANSMTSEFTVDLPQKSLFRRRLSFNLSGLLGLNYLDTTVAGTPSSTTTWIPGAAANIYVAPWILNRYTSVVPSISTRFLFPASGGYLSANAGITLAHQIGQSGRLGLTYNWSGSGSSGAIPGYSHQLISGDIEKQFGYRLRMGAGPSYDLTEHALYANSYLGFAISPLWSFDAEAQLSSSSFYTYNDWQLGISRSILGRNLRLFYDAATHKVRIEVAGGQFGF